MKKDARRLLTVTLVRSDPLVLAIDDGCSGVSENELVRTGYSPGKLQAIRREIELGEWRRREMDGPTPVPARAERAIAARAAAGIRRRPGQRLPVRDRVPVAQSAR